MVNILSTQDRPVVKPLCSSLIFIISFNRSFMMRPYISNSSCGTDAWIIFACFSNLFYINIDVKYSNFHHFGRSSLEDKHLLKCKSVRYLSAISDAFLSSLLKCVQNLRISYLNFFSSVVLLRLLLFQAFFLLL